MQSMVLHCGVDGIMSVLTQLLNTAPYPPPLLFSFPLPRIKE